MDTLKQSALGRLQGGEVAALAQGQEEKAGGGRPSVQPCAGGGARGEEDAPPEGSGRGPPLLPRLQAALDRHHHCWPHAVEGAERTPPVPPREKTGEGSWSASIDPYWLEESRGQST